MERPLRQVFAVKEEPGSCALLDFLAAETGCHNRPLLNKQVGGRDEEEEELEGEIKCRVAAMNPTCTSQRKLRAATQSLLSSASCGSAHTLRHSGNDLTVTGISLATRFSALCVDLPLLGEGGVESEVEAGFRKPCVFATVKPCNLEQEKAKFFLSDFTYNPHFEYSHPVSSAMLERYNTASNRFLTQAVRILEQALRRYSSYEKFELATGGSLLPKNRIKSYVKKYMEKEGCVGEVVVHLSEDLLSRASMTVMSTRSILTINVSTAREFWLEGLLRHEIGTHYFRGMNNGQQPWANASARHALNLRPPNPTEEGLASLHSVLHRKDPTLWRAALLYYTVHQASQLAFADLFQDLQRFVSDPNTRWDYCIRAKRGQAYTGQPGCFSKDQVYLDGVMKLLRYRETIDFQLLMSLGKVSYEDVERLRDLAVLAHTRLPHFLRDRDRYARHLRRIMEVNQLSDGELQALI
ncbi:putative tyrosine carboxypeptidase MATCAP2 [Anguilla rostrata]|uniref:putative tyrosine carboxypeptidase MATCAP2 n=1 Tax=Anguilla rostrata TaxID=7938 RepID=UPI0030D2CF5A